MRVKHLSSLIFAVLMLCFAATTDASAQTVEARGKVTLTAADGTLTPVENAIVTIYRTDIKGKYETKTNRKGEYVRVGLPFGGTYTVTVSAPNARPSYQSGVRFGQLPNGLDFTLSSGDGSTVTLEQVQALINSAPAASGGATAAAPAKETEEARKERERIAKETAEIEAKNARATELNAKLPQILKTANDAFTAKKYDEAITAYDQGIAADPTQGVFHINKAIALRSRAVEKYNTAVKNSDKEARTAGVASAREDMKISTDAADKAVAAYKQTSTSGAAPDAKQADILKSALEQRKESYTIALRINTPDVAEKAVPAFEEYVASETDPAKKAKAQASLGEALFASGKTDEAVAAYKQILTQNPSNLDALYGLGLALTAVEGKTAEARDTLKQFVAKASGAEYEQKKKEAEEIVTQLDDAIKTDAEQKNQPAAPARGRKRGN